MTTPLPFWVLGDGLRHEAGARKKSDSRLSPRRSSQTARPRKAVQRPVMHAAPRWRRHGQPDRKDLARMGRPISPSHSGRGGTGDSCHASTACRQRRGTSSGDEIGGSIRAADEHGWSGHLPTVVRARIAATLHGLGGGEQRRGSGRGVLGEKPHDDRRGGRHQRVLVVGHEIRRGHAEVGG